MLRHDDYDVDNQLFVDETYQIQLSKSQQHKFNLST